MSQKLYKSLADAIADTVCDDSVRQEFQDQVKRRQVVKHLVALRAAKGRSQAEVAKKMGCTQSRISKLEKGFDADMRLGDLESYLDSLGLELELGFVDRNMRTVDKVKYHAFSIKKLMDRLANLARDDEKIARAVSTFFGEAFFNLVNMVQDSAKKLPRQAKDDRPHLQIEIRTALSKVIDVEGDPPTDEDVPKLPDEQPCTLAET